MRQTVELDYCDKCQCWHIPGDCQIIAEAVLNEPEAASKEEEEHIESRPEP